MSDQFSSRAASAEGPAGVGFAIIANDEARLLQVTRALYVGTGGRLTVEMQQGGVVDFHNIPNGALLPVRVIRVLETTTAAHIVGLC